MNNPQRRGRFTSSQIYKLIPEGNYQGFQKPAINYIDEKIIERRMGRTLDTGGYSQSAAWGLFMEQVLFQRLPVDYEISSNETKVHPEHKLIWAGSTDLKIKDLLIADQKSYQPKKFAQYTDCILKEDLKLFKESFPQEYWQLVSNAAIEQVDHAQAISFMPYAKDMDEIRKIAADYEGSDMWKYRFIYEKPNEELAVLPNDGYYKDFNEFTFKVPEEDTELLEIRIIEAGFILETA